MPEENAITKLDLKDKAVQIEIGRALNNELAVAQTQALTNIAQAFNEIANFITGSGLGNLLQGHAKAQAVTAIAGGLASHDGRNSLDARVMEQNGLEIAKFVETYHETYARILREKNSNSGLQAVVEEDPGNRYYLEDGTEVDKKGVPVPGAPKRKLNDVDAA